MPAADEYMRGFRVGDWQALPERGLLERNGEQRHVEPLVMDVFVVLARYSGDVVTKDQLIAEVWHGRPQTDDVITRCISALRRALDDNAKAPQYIETLQKRGYRLMLPAVITEPEGTGPAAASALPASTRPDFLLIAVALVAVLGIAAYAFFGPKQRVDIDENLQSIAVFPFDCLADVAEASEHLCFGFAEAVIKYLKQAEGVQVIRFRQPSQARPRDVQGIVSGSVQIIGNNVRVAAQYADSASREIVALETADGTRNDIFTMQNDIAIALATRVTGIAAESFTTPDPSPSFAAEEAYMLGRYLFEKRTHEATLGAITEFEKAISLKPDYGAAWLGLAYAYIIWPDYDISVDREEIYTKALDTVAAGIDADPTIREAAGTVYGFVYHKRHRWFDAIDAFELAIGSESVQPIAHHWYSWTLASVGRLEDASRHARRALRLDPEHPDRAVFASRVAITYLWLNDMAQAGRYFEIATRLGLETPMAELAHSLYQVRSGQIDKAKEIAIHGIEQVGLDTGWVSPVLDGIGDPSRRAEAIAIFEQVAASGELLENAEITVWMLLGEVDRAMQVARRLETERGLFELELIFIDEFRALHRHPEFPAFTEAVGLNEYWENSNCRWLDDRIRCGDS